MADKFSLENEMDFPALPLTPGLSGSREVLTPEAASSPAMPAATSASMSSMMSSMMAPSISQRHRHSSASLKSGGSGGSHSSASSISLSSITAGVAASGNITYQYPSMQSFKLAQSSVAGSSAFGAPGSGRPRPGSANHFSTVNNQGDSKGGGGVMSSSDFPPLPPSSSSQVTPARGANSRPNSANPTSRPPSTSPAPAATAANSKSSSPALRESQSSRQEQPPPAPAAAPTDEFSLAALIHKLHDPACANELFFMVGLDIADINVDLNNKHQIYRFYPGPFNEKPLRADQIDYPIPAEYLLSQTAESSRLPELATTLAASLDDTLFFLFYFFAGETMQAVASRELHRRDWRFHADEERWFHQVEGARAAHQASLASMSPARLFSGGATPPVSEHGHYVYFEPTVWRRVTKEMTIKYDRLLEPAAACSVGQSSLLSEMNNSKLSHLQ